MGHLDIVKYLVLEKKCDPIIDKDGTGNTPIHQAALNGHLDALLFLISEKGCDPTIPGHEGNTLIHFAAAGGHLDTVKYLMEQHGSNPAQHNLNHHTPLSLASQAGHLDVVKYLVLEKGCDPSVDKDKSGDTPMHHAALGGHLSSGSASQWTLGCREIPTSTIYKIFSLV